MINRQDATGADRYVARYHNCPDNEHAEAFLLQDQALREALQPQRVEDEALGEGARLVLYLNRQPCHNSGNYLRESTSCTQDLLLFYHQHLSPRRIALEVSACERDVIFPSVGAEQLSLLPCRGKIRLRRKCNNS
jgi:hypothetical protein